MYLPIGILVLLLGCIEASIVHAPYQVGIFLFDNYNPNFGARNFPICSAAIIHPLWLVSTADCLHAHITSSNIARPLLPNSVYIKSGNFSEIRENIKYVHLIHIHPEFNSNTMKNDIALIQVDSTFRFENAYNERWIQLSDRFSPLRNCIYSINTPNATEMYPFSELRQTSVVNNDFCYGNKSNYMPEVNNRSLCSFYDFDHPFMCKIPFNQLRLNRDRGTPLICENKLVGILSIIIPSNVTNSTDSCVRTLRTYAYYIEVGLYEKWIHSVMAVNSPTHASDGKPISLIPSSPPYQITTTQKLPTKSIASTIKSHFAMTIFIALATCSLIHKFTKEI